MLFMIIFVIKPSVSTEGECGYIGNSFMLSPTLFIKWLVNEKKHDLHREDEQ